MLRIKSWPAAVAVICAVLQSASAGEAFERVRHSINDTDWKFKRAEVEEGYKPHSFRF